MGTIYLPNLEHSGMLRRLEFTRTWLPLRLAISTTLPRTDKRFRYRNCPYDPELQRPRILSRTDKNAALHRGKLCESSGVEVHRSGHHHFLQDVIDGISKQPRIFSLRREHCKHFQFRQDPITGLFQS